MCGGIHKTENKEGGGKIVLAKEDSSVKTEYKENGNITEKIAKNANGSYGNDGMLQR